MNCMAKLLIYIKSLIYCSFVVIAVLLSLARAEWVFEVWVHSYGNPGNHRMAEGGGGRCCCDPSFTCNINIMCTDPCDIIFTFSTNVSSTIQKTTKPLEASALSFTDHIGSLENPIKFSGNALDGKGGLGVRLLVMVSDVDVGSMDTPVDDITVQSYFLKTVMYSTLQEFQGFVSVIMLHFRLRCAVNYYSIDCSKYCVPHDNNEAGHYTCDANGDKQCLPGYQQPSTNCTAPLCSTGCTTNHMTSTVITTPTQGPPPTTDSRVVVAVGGGVGGLLALDLLLLILLVVTIAVLLRRRMKTFSQDITQPQSTSIEMRALETPAPAPFPQQEKQDSDL